MSYRKDTESGMGEYSLRKPKRKGIGIAAAVVLVLCLLAGTGVIISNHQNQKKPEEKKEKVYQSLSATDRETADLYAELYETDREQVAKIQEETKDWEQTGRNWNRIFSPSRKIPSTRWNRKATVWMIWNRQRSCP